MSLSRERTTSLPLAYHVLLCERTTSLVQTYHVPLSWTYHVSLSLSRMHFDSLIFFISVPILKLSYSCILLLQHKYETPQLLDLLGIMTLHWWWHSKTISFQYYCANVDSFNLFFPSQKPCLSLARSYFYLCAYTIMTLCWWQQRYYRSDITKFQ